MEYKKKQKTLSERFNIRQYLNLIETISKVEYKNLGSNYLIDLSEMIQIGIQVVYQLASEKKFPKYNSSYISNAIKWAIRNEIRRRCKWYSLKITNDNSCDKSSKNIIQMDNTDNLSIREAVYKTIISIDAMEDSEKPVQIKDTTRTPEELLVFHELSEHVKEALDILSQREREFIENRFYKDKKLKDLSLEYNISTSRISRIIQGGLNKIRDHLSQKHML